MIVMAEDTIMDAAHKLYKNTVMFALALAVVLAGPVLAQPQFQVTSANVVLQGTGGAIVGVTSSGAGQGTEITFTISAPDYSSDTNRGGVNWLGVVPTGAGIVTPFALPQYGINFNVVTTAGLPAGNHTATVTLTATSPSGVTPQVINVSFNASGGGGSGTLSAAPNPINITSSTSATAAVTVAINTTSVSSISIAVNSSVTTGGTNWLSAGIATNSSSFLSAAGGTSITVQVSPSGLAAGATYLGTVTVSPSVGATLSIPVNYTVATFSSGTLTFSPSNNRSWTFSTGGLFPAADPLSVSSSTGALTYSATATSSNGWLLVNGNIAVQGIPLSQGIVVQPGSNITSLTTGTYSGRVDVTDSNGGTGSIFVTLTVNGGTVSGLTVTPNPLTFNVAFNGGASQQNLTATTTSGGAVSATTSGGAWLSVSAGGTINAGSSGLVTVIVNPAAAGLVSGTYNGSVNVTVGSQSQAVQVVLNYGTTGGTGGGNTTNLQPNSISLTFQSGTSPSFVSRPFISITGPTGNWTSSVTNQSGGNWLSISPSSGASLPDQTQVLVDPTILASLAVGSYSGTISIATPGGTQSVTVSLTIVSSPVLLYNTQGAPLIFNFQTSGARPPGQALFFTASDGSAFDLTTGSVTANASWINVAVFARSLSVSVDPTGLTGGVYTSSITVNPGTLGSLNLPVVLVINNGAGGSAGPLSFAPSAISFSAAAGTTPAPVALSVSAATGTLFTVAASSQTGSWLTVDHSAGTTNMNIIVSANPAGLAAGTYNGTLTFTANSAIQTVPVTLTVTGGGGGGTGNVTVTPATLAFSAQAPAGVLPVQSLAVNGTGTYTVVVTTTSNGAWLTTTAGLSTLVAGQALAVTVNATGLAAGVYQGNIRVISGNIIDVPVTLTLTAPPTVSATPTTLSFTYRAGDAVPAARQISVDGGGAALPFTASVSSSAAWLDVTPKTGTTPATLSVTVNPANLSASNYTGTITVAGTGSATGTTTITVQLAVSIPPATITRVTNAASYIAGNISPGEIITIFGTNIGPVTAAGAALDSTGKVSTSIGGTQVLVQGFLAPIIYASSTQVSAVVPYEIAGFVSANVQVRFLGQTSNGVLVNVSSTQPGLFTQNASGAGPGAILNQNSTTNGPSNPANRGDTVVVFLTGEGQTSPPGVTGKVTTVNTAPPFTPGPLLPIAILIGGQAAQYTFAGEAPGFVSGAMQLNVIVPQTAGSGDLQITVGIGSNTSQTGVTVSVR